MVHWIFKLSRYENGLTCLIRYPEYGQIYDIYYMYFDCVWAKPELISTFIGKNPDVDTSFLPDRDREEEENKLRYRIYSPISMVRL